MKKVKGFLEKHNVDKWMKKYRIILGIEVAVLVIFVCFGAMTYKMIFDRVNSSASDTYSMVTRFDIEYSARGDGSVEDILTYIRNNIAYKHSTYAARPQGYGMMWEMYDKEGNVIEKSTDNFITVEWSPEYEEEDYVNCTYFLENYFSKEEMDGFLSYYYTESGDFPCRQAMGIVKMTGYYDENEEFVPSEIVFIDYNDENDEYTLTSSKHMNMKDVEYITRWNEKRVEEQGEKGYFECTVYDSLDKSVEKAKKLFEEHNDGVDSIREILTDGTHSGTYSNATGRYGVAKFDFGDNEVAGMAIAVHVDRHYLTLHDQDFKFNLIVEFILCQLVAGAMIYFYIDNEKKKKALVDMRNTFINAMAHEMKTPASVILNSGECIKEGIHPEKHDKYIDKVSNEALHLNSLLNDMLVYTRVSDEEYELNKERISLVEILRETCNHYSTFMEQKKINLQWEIVYDCVIEADRRLIEMVLDNYISNAVKYCKESGTIKIIIDADRIKVYNDGERVDPAIISHIWDPLFTADESRKKNNGSSGMGLAICASIMKLHDMDYGVKNVRDGVEFYIQVNRK